MRGFTYVLLVCISFSTPLFADEKQWIALDEATIAQANSGRLAEALKTGEEALALARREFGNEDRRTASSLALLAEVLMALDRWPEAEEKLREAAAIRERVLKPGDPDLEQSDNLMGRIRAKQGRFEEAERLYLKALAAAEKAAKAGEVGPQAPRWTDLIASLNQLAFFYSSRGDQPKASAMRKRAVAALGRYAKKDKEDHLGRLEDLIRNAIDAGDYADAETMTDELLRLSQRYFGKSEVAKSLSCVAEMYGTQKQYARAEPLYQRSLAVREKTLGPDHPDVGTSLYELGELYYGKSEYEQAESFYKRALAIREKALGPDHTDVAASLHSLAVMYFVQGQNADAEPLYKRTLAIREKALGPDHADVAWSLYYLAWLYDDEEKYEEAESLYKRAQAIFETAYGPDDSTVAMMLEKLAAIYRKTGRDDDAEALEKRVAAIRGVER